MISAGFVITNSEGGSGAYTITPRAVIQVCRNGLTEAKDVMGAVHLGGRHDEGVVSWSGQTQRKTVELIMAKIADAVRTFLSREYVVVKVRRVRAAAGRRLVEPTKAVKVDRADPDRHRPGRRSGSACAARSGGRRRARLTNLVRAGNLPEPGPHGPHPPPRRRAGTPSWTARGARPVPKRGARRPPTAA
ncbi:hypothetical protein ACWET9_37980 [Streptomyces sp. NPDC004059]